MENETQARKGRRDCRTAATRNKKCVLNIKTSLEGRALALALALVVYLSAFGVCAMLDGGGNVVSLPIKVDFHLIDMW